MATCAENKTTADAFIVTLYPEIVGLSVFMDTIAALGRLMFTVTLDDKDHGPAIAAECESQLTGTGYKINRTEMTVVISCA